MQLLKLVLLLTALTSAHGISEEPWPNALDAFTNGGDRGTLHRRDLVELDFRHYHQLAALELLLVHHGFLHCQVATGGSVARLEEVLPAVEAFQRNHSLTVDALELDQAFWERLVVPLHPGDSNPAVSSLKWLLQATRESSRGPLWDEGQQGCSQLFDQVLQDDLSSNWSVAEDVMAGLGLPSDLWRRLLMMPEARPWQGCKHRARVAHGFGASWVIVWFVMVVAFAVFHDENFSRKQVSRAAMEAHESNGAVWRWLLWGREAVVLLAATVCHSLSVLGVWSLSKDFASQVFAGWQLAAGSAAVLRLSGLQSRSRNSRSALPLLWLGLFTLVTTGLYCLIGLIDNEHAYLTAAAIFMATAVWVSLVTPLAATSHRASRAALGFVVLATAALPGLLPLVAGATSGNGSLGIARDRALVPLMLTPAFLMLVSAVIEGPIGRVVDSCEYTAETQWLLAAIFRLSVELIRLMSALALLLVSQVLVWPGMQYLIMQAVLTVLTEGMLRAPEVFRAGEDKHQFGDARPFTAAEIVLKVDADPWSYRYRAPTMAIEGVLFSAHLLQLALVGLPVGVSAGTWFTGLAVVGGSALLRHALALVLAHLSRAPAPQVPWFKLPAHLLALMLGAGLSLSSPAQASMLWLMYGHHWAACFASDWRGDDIETSIDRETALAALTSVLASVLAAANLTAFLSWAEWTLRLRAEGDELVRTRTLESVAFQNYRKPWTLLPSLQFSSRAPEAAKACYVEPILSPSNTMKSVRSMRSRSGPGLVGLSPTSRQSSHQLLSSRNGDDSSPVFVRSSMSNHWDEALNDLCPRTPLFESEDATTPTIPGAMPAEDMEHTLSVGYKPLGAGYQSRLEVVQRHNKDPDQSINDLLQSLDPSTAPSDNVTQEDKTATLRHSSESTSDVLEESAFHLRHELIRLKDEVEDLLGELPQDTAEKRPEDTQEKRAEDAEKRQTLREAATVEEVAPDLLSSATNNDLDRLLKADNSGEVGEMLAMLDATPAATLDATLVDTVRPDTSHGAKLAISEALDADRLAEAAAEASAEASASKDPEWQSEMASEPMVEEELAAMEERQRREEEAAAAEAAEQARREREAAQAEQREREEVERRRAEEERLRLEREAAERAAAAERERLEREAAEQEAARREAAKHVLLAAIAARCRSDIEQCLQRSQEDFLPVELVAEAERVLQEIALEETRAAAKSALEEAMAGESVDALHQAMEHAREVGVTENLLSLSSTRLHTLELVIARREAATAALGQLMELYSPDLQASLPEEISELLKKLKEATREIEAAGVSRAQVAPAANEAMNNLEVWRDRNQALRDMDERLKEQDVAGTKEALERAKEFGVDPAEVSRVEHGLAVLIDEIELADNKVQLITRRIEQAMAARSEAEAAQTSRQVEILMGESSVLTALRAAIDDAKKTRMVKKNAIAKAEAVAAEVSADLKRILEDKQLEEKRIATERLRSDLEAARSVDPTTHEVLTALREAIAAAEEYRADTKEAEAMLAQLTTEYEHNVRIAQEDLEQALQEKDAQTIKAGIERCKSLHLESPVVTAMERIRGIFTQDAASARSMQQREDRLASVAKLAALVGVLRANGDQNLRHMHNELQDLKGALRVFCRIRPLNSRETKKGDSIAMEAVDAFTVGIQAKQERQTYEYDTIFGPGSSQAEVFAECKTMVQSAVDGYNATIFTYGQTGAGKTWTLYGSGAEPGISPRLCEEVFRFANRDKENFGFVVKAQMIELYLNDLRDLLQKSKGDQPKLELRSLRNPDGSTRVSLEGATMTQVGDADDLARVVASGLGNRKVRATQMNADSSRSHLMLIIHLEVTDRASGQSRNGKITLVDLAGSERLSKSGATGEGAKEAIEINKSLTALGDVMMAFTSRAKLIPYRNHKLTQLMQDSLGGTAKTLMFVNVSPSSSNVDETVNSLKYASRARCIENDVQVQPARKSSVAGRESSSSASTSAAAPR